jgi:hypothetical protein
MALESGRQNSKKCVFLASCKTPNFCDVDRNSGFTGDFDLEKSAAKVHSFAATFAMISVRYRYEHRLRAGPTFTTLYFSTIRQVHCALLLLRVTESDPAPMFRDRRSRARAKSTESNSTNARQSV